MSLATAVLSDDLRIASEWDAMVDIVPDESFTPSSAANVNDVLEEWTSDEEDSDFNMMEVDEQIGFNLFADSIFGEEAAAPPPLQLDSMHVDQVPPYVGAQDFPFTDSKQVQGCLPIACRVREAQRRDTHNKPQASSPISFDEI